MTVDQALQMAESLCKATREAVQHGDVTVDVHRALQAADDAAREELARAIERGLTRVSDRAEHGSDRPR